MGRCGVVAVLDLCIKPIECRRALSTTTLQRATSTQRVRHHCCRKHVLRAAARI